MRRFRRNSPARLSLYIVAALALIAILAPVLANDRPLYAEYKGHRLFPAFTFKNNYYLQMADGDYERIQPDIADWKQMQLDNVIWAPVPYAPDKTDRLNSAYVSPAGKQLFRDAEGQVVDMPARFRHRLGTNSLGEDVLAGLIHGTRISLSIGCIAMVIAALIGLLLGSVAGYFGDERLVSTRGRALCTMPGIFFGWFYGWQARQIILRDALAGNGYFAVEALISICIFAGIVLLFSFAGKFAGRLPWLNKQISIPADSLISRTIEILHSLPTFILILTIAAIARPSLVHVMVIIGLTNWTGIARLVRAELLRVRELEYVQAARSMGFSEWKIIVHHALPNSIAPALVSIAFGIASAILTESSLSFLGIGVPSDTVTWGSLVNDGRQQFSAWWLVVFPGLAIFLTVTLYNLIGEGLRDALDPKLQK